MYRRRGSVSNSWSRHGAFALGLLALFTLPAVRAGAATIDVADGDVAGLIAAITTANGNGESDTIRLAPDGLYVLTAVDNTTNGPSGLPQILSDSSHDLTIDGRGATLRRNAGAPPFNFLVVAGSADLTLERLQLEGGSRHASGGAISVYGSLTVEDCRFAGNSSGVDGGAVVNRGTLIARRSRFTSNVAAKIGGAIFNFNGTALIERSLFDGNWVTNADGFGGALANVGSLTLTGSTLSGNGSQLYGALSLVTGTATIVGATVTANTGGVFANSGQAGVIRNSIIAANTGFQLHGGFAPGSGNNLVGSNPRLGPLADNGGDLPSHAPRPNSPALDAGDNAFVVSPADVRGFDRISGGPSTSARSSCSSRRCWCPPAAAARAPRWAPASARPCGSRRRRPTASRSPAPA